MKKNKNIIIGLLIIFTVCFLVSCDKNNKDALKVGMELEFEPFEMTDEKGNPTGISVDLAKELGEYLGREVEIVNMSFSGLLPSLMTSKIDLIISSMSITDERKEQVNFSDPYAKIYLALLVNVNSDVEVFEDLDNNDKVVAVKKGTTGHIYAEENLKNAKINVFEKENACVLEVTQGKADAFIYDQMSVYKHYKNNQNKTKALLKPFQDNIEGWAVAVKKDNDELLNNVNEFIKKFKSEDGFERLSNKYLSEEKAAFRELGIPFFFD